MRIVYIVALIFVCMGMMSYIWYMKTNNNKSIILGLVGDVMLGRLTNEMILQRGDTYPWGNMLEQLQMLDGLIINLETTITTQTHATPKVFNFKADPSTVTTLQKAHVTVANLANNHSLDFGPEGLTETLSILHRAGIQTVGAGSTFQEATQEVILEIHGIRIGIIGCTDNEPTWEATKNKPGVFFVDSANLHMLIEQIRIVRNTVDILIVTYHWGPNWDDNPSDEIRARAHAIIDAGADLIHGHSAHIIQGIEQYKHGIIIYGAGDFIDDYAVDQIKRNDYGALYKLALRDKKIDHLLVVPTHITHMQVNKADAITTKAILERIAAQSKKLGTTVNVHKDSITLSLNKKA